MANLAIREKVNYLQVVKYYKLNKIQSDNKLFTFKSFGKLLFKATKPAF